MEHWRKTFLREWRKHRGRSLEDVAPRMGISNAQLSRIERGLQPYSQRVLEVAAEVYGTTVPDLLVRRPGDESAAIFHLSGDRRA